MCEIESKRQRKKDRKNKRNGERERDRKMFRWRSSVASLPVLRVRDRVIGKEVLSSLFMDGV